MGKQATPRDVQSYASDFNDIISRFVDYVQSTRECEGAMDDMCLPLKRLLMECMYILARY